MQRSGIVGGTSAVVDYEELLDTSFNDANKSYQTNVLPRWQRKQLQQQQKQQQHQHQQHHQQMQVQQIQNQPPPPQQQNVSGSSSGGLGKIAGVELSSTTTSGMNNVISNAPRIPFGKSVSLSGSNNGLVNGDRFIPSRGNMELAKHQMMHRPTASSSGNSNKLVDIDIPSASSLMYGNENSLNHNSTTTANNNNNNHNESSSATGSGDASSSSSQHRRQPNRSVVTDKKDMYASSLSSALLGVEDMKNNRILSYTEKAPVPTGDSISNLNVLYSATASASEKKHSTRLVNRQIPSAPSRILDAPDLLDDYYLNLVSWNDANVLAVALGQTVYLWNATTSQIDELCTFQVGINAHISSVQWVQQGGTHLAVGVSTGATQLWDVQAFKQVRSMDGHTDRVSSLSWNRHIVSSGSRDTKIVHHDVRIAEHNIACLSAHTQEVCGLAWSLDGETLASGGNDNLLCLWNATASSSHQRPRFMKTEHQAAVKALAWSPTERTLLASGAGTADRTIKFWNTTTGSLLNSIDTGSQVCSLLWSPYEKEILSSHGYSRNQLTLWKYPSMAKVKEFEGHTSRVLHMACSPIDGTVLSAAADETLRFWEIFAPPASSTVAGGGSGTAGTKLVSTKNGDCCSTKTNWTMQIR